MTVTVTSRDILLAAYGKSSKNKPDVIATAESEMLDVVYRATSGLYSVAARVNSGYFGATSTVTLAAGAWARPVTAESISLIERVAGTTGGVGAAGDEVIVVPIRQRSADPLRGAVYEWGQQYYSAGNTNDPTGGDLKFYFSRWPVLPADLDTALDSLWVEAYNELLILETALYLSGKDGGPRREELGQLNQDRMGWLARFVAFLQHETANEVRRHVTTVSLPDLLPQLAPGSPSG